MTETTRRLAKPAFAGKTWERKRIRRLVLGHLAERMSALTRFVVCRAHVTIMPDECRGDVTAFIGSLAPAISSDWRGFHYRHQFDMLCHGEDIESA